MCLVTSHHWYLLPTSRKKLNTIMTYKVPLTVLRQQNGSTAFVSATALRLCMITYVTFLHTHCKLKKWKCQFRIISQRQALEQQTLDFVVDVGGTLGRYLLNYVHRGPVVAAHTLIMTADHAVRSSQRKDNITAVRAVVAADAVPLCHGQSVEGNGGRLLTVWDTATGTVPPQYDQQNYDDQKEDHTATDNPH